MVECCPGIHIDMRILRYEVENQIISARADGFEPCDIYWNSTVLDSCDFDDAGAATDGSRNINFCQHFRKERVEALNVRFAIVDDVFLFDALYMDRRAG